MLWYSVPGFSSIECDEQGNIRSTRTQKLRKLQKRWGQPGQETRYWIDVRDPDKPRKKSYISRLILAAKLGRKLEQWEEARHMNGNHADNRMDNLEVGCRLNNILDDIESGRLHTSAEQIDKAIKRLQTLKESRC